MAFDGKSCFALQQKVHFQVFDGKGKETMVAILSSCFQKFFTFGRLSFYEVVAAFKDFKSELLGEKWTAWPSDRAGPTALKLLLWTRLSVEMNKWWAQTQEQHFNRWLYIIGAENSVPE